MKSFRLFRGWLAVFAILLALLYATGWATAVTAAPSGSDSSLTIKAQAGWDGRGVPNCTAPAVVNLKNQSSADLRGVVEAVTYAGFIPESFYGPFSPGKSLKYFPIGAYGQEITLPPGVTTKVVLWFPFPDAQGKLLFRFRAEDKVLASTEVKMAPGLVKPFPLGSAVGVLGNVPQALEQFRFSLVDPQFQKPPVIRLTPELLPRTVEELDAFGVILLTAAGTTGLTPGQSRGLLEWVEEGGNLVLAGGPEINKTLSALPPGTVKITATGLGRYQNWQQIAAWLGLKEAATPQREPVPVSRLTGEGIRWGPQGAPLGMQTTWGKGKVTVLSFDPTAEPWRSGSTGQALWEKLLLPLSPEWGGFVPRFFTEQSFQLIHQTNYLPAEAFPSWPAVGLYLLVFLLVAGPVTYCLLRRRQCPEYTWLAVPALAIVFTGAVYFYAVQTGRNVIVNVLQVADVTFTRSRGFTAAGFFAPTLPVLNLYLADPGRPVKAASVPTPSESFASLSNPPYTLTRGQDLKLQFEKSSQWGMRPVFFRQDVEKEAGGLVAKLRVEDSRLVGAVRNQTGKKLDHVTLLFGTGYKVLGNLAPGQEVAVELPVPPLSRHTALGEPPPFQRNWQIFLYPEGPPPVAAGPSPYPQPPRKPTIAEQRRASLLEIWCGAFFYRSPFPNSGTWPLTLVAWSTEPLKEVKVKGLRNRIHYLSMIIKRPEIELPRGSFKLPYGLIIPEITEFRGGGTFGHNNLTGMESGAVTFAFHPNLPPNAEIREITVHLPFFPARLFPATAPMPGKPSLAPQPVAPGAFAVYHPGSDSWKELSGATSFTLPGEYVLPGGEVRVRVKGTGGPQSEKGFYFLPPQVSFQGVVE
ncbi:MAG: hypothetical protein QME13_02620 [Thermoanaerobacteraceae bacterium]|nr:hypothetical protein [Thermoanaerobacteraceae bacterium]